MSSVSSIVASAFLLNYLVVFSSIANAGATLSGCTLSIDDKSFELKGKYQVVESFPDFKVQVVSSFAQLHVEKVTSFPDQCGKWQEVSSFPDFKIQFVESFPDLKIKWVDSFPGAQ